MKHVESSIAVFETVARKQAEKGLEKYDQSLDPLDKRYDWLEMAMEELVDGIQYLHAEMIKRKYIVMKIREEIQTGVTPEKYDKINRLLDELEGGASLR